MPKTILYTAVTLDGYIADTNGGIDFLDHPLFRLPDEDYGYNSFYEGIDAVIMGHNTFEKIKSFEGSYPIPISIRLYSAVTKRWLMDSLRELKCVIILLRLH